MNMQKTTYLLIGAELLNESIENIRSEFVYENPLIQCFRIYHHEDEIYVKIEKPGKYQNPFLNKFSLETEVLAIRQLDRLGQLKSPEIIEYNTSKDLISQSYLALKPPLDASFINHTKLKSIAFEVDRYLQIFHQQTDSDVFGDLNGQINYQTWSETFENYYQQAIKQLYLENILTNENEILFQELFQSIEEVIETDSKPSLINLHPQFDFISVDQNQHFHGFTQHSHCFFAPPEFALCYYLIQKAHCLPMVQNLQKNIQEDMCTKAKFILYYVYFLFDDALYDLHFQQNPNALKKIEMATSLANSALDPN